MSSDYAIQFEVVPPAPERAAACARLLAGEVASWVKQQTQQTCAAGFDLPLDGGTARLGEREEATLTHEAWDDAHFYEITLARAEEDDPALLRTTRVRVACADGGLEAAVSVRDSSTGGPPRRGQTAPTRPGLVDTLLAHYPCRIAGMPVPAGPLRLDAGDVPRFVAHTLERAGRLLPVVLISPEPATGGPVVEPDALARPLLGLALIAELTTVDASYALTEYVGDRRLSCYLGAVRVYWPGFAVSDDPFTHPLFFPDSIARNEALGRPLDHHLLRLFSEAAALRRVDGPVLRRAREVITEGRAREAEALRGQLRARNSLTETADQILDQYVRENAALARRIAELEEDNRLLRAALSAGPDPDPGSDDAETAPGSVLDALRRAAEAHADILEVWSDAEESARKSRYGNPAEVFQALAGLADVGRLWRAAVTENTSMGGDWSRHLRDRGLKFTARESQTTMSKYGEERVYRDRDTKRSAQMSMHLKLGNGGDDNCLRVYFQPDDRGKNQGKICIGHCGVHQPIAGR